MRTRPLRRRLGARRRALGEERVVLARERVAQLAVDAQAGAGDRSARTSSRLNACRCPIRAASARLARPRGRSGCPPAAPRPARARATRAASRSSGSRVRDVLEHVREHRQVVRAVLGGHVRAVVGLEPPDARDAARAGDLDRRRGELEAVEASPSRPGLAPAPPAARRRRSRSRPPSGAAPRARTARRRGRPSCARPARASGPSSGPPRGPRASSPRCRTPRGRRCARHAPATALSRGSVFAVLDRSTTPDTRGAASGPAASAPASSGSGTARRVCDRRAVRPDAVGGASSTGATSVNSAAPVRPDLHVDLGCGVRADLAPQRGPTAPALALDHERRRESSRAPAWACRC